MTTDSMPSSKSAPKRSLSRKAWLWLATPPLALLACYGLWVILALLRGEHFYGGRPTSYWRLRLLLWESSDIPQNLQKMTGLAQGPVERPFRPGVLSRTSEAVPVLRDLLRDPDEKVRLAALWGLHQVQPDSDAAVAALELALDDEAHGVRIRAAWSLMASSRESPAARAALCRALKNKDPRLREFVLGLWPASDTVSPEAIVAIREALNDEDLGVSSTAAGVLKRLEKEIRAKSR